jgi:hypothetical protein
MSLPKVPNPFQVVLELPPGYEGSGDPRPRSAEPTAVILASDILRWLIPKVGKFPKNVRFGLGARLEAAHFDVLEELIRAQYARGGGRPPESVRDAAAPREPGPRRRGGTNYMKNRVGSV